MKPFPVFNFCAGPAMLPDPVLNRVRDELKGGIKGLSPFSVSHRSVEFFEIIERSEESLRKLLQIPQDYHVLFVPAGGTLQFGLVPINLLRDHGSADYAVTGYWGEKAYEEGLRFAPVKRAIYTGPEYTTIPPVDTWQINSKAAYLHYTPNETVDGVQFKEVPDVPLPLVADCSSELLSKPMDISRFALIYAATQKNLGPAGLSLVVVHRDFVGFAKKAVPSLCDYASYATTHSLFNTPPTFTWYVVDLMLQWFLSEGGPAVFETRNEKKAQKLYDTIDASGGFYDNRVEKAYRSVMNVVFFLPNETLESAFLQGAQRRGLMNLSGYRVKGGIRASLYNAMPEAGVDALIAWMKTFQEEQA